MVNNYQIICFLQIIVDFKGLLFIILIKVIIDMFRLVVLYFA